MMKGLGHHVVRSVPRSLTVFGATLIALVGGLAAAPAGPAGAAPSRITPVSEASTSSRGVTAHSINVEFPVANLQSLSSQLGFAGDTEYTEQVKAIDLFVHHVNATGGINGRMINPMITTFDPTNDAQLEARCTDWTQGSPPVFAVLDGVGTWTGDSQLCITREGHTPFLGQWTTVSDWTKEGSPYLWWTGPDDAAILQATVNWGHSSGLLGRSRKVGVLAGDRASDQLALKKYLLPDLKKDRCDAGGRDHPRPAERDRRHQQCRAVGGGAVQGGRRELADPADPVQRLLPGSRRPDQPGLLPPAVALRLRELHRVGARASSPSLTRRHWTARRGSRPKRWVASTTPDRSPRAATTRASGECWDIWHKAYPQIPKGNMNDFIEEQGPVQGWCQEIRLFTEAATMAGKDLNRRTFVEAMSRITDFPGGFSPVLSYGPEKFYGPTQYQVVSLHTNKPPSSLCRLPLGHLPPQGVCWHVVQTWKPLPATP